MLDSVLTVWTPSVTDYPAGCLGQAKCLGTVWEVSPKIHFPIAEVEITSVSDGSESNSTFSD